ncbi:predicted protein [Verticillium alfalfae VaMs.102]|uniref:Predicted protein n=1 Tax=Verticillium alfalfae (strain VaMs.102 / ATCC MYA-4576 / FGSC 10136) TaxID=526221 RepID=C9SFN7_VERA1|nr:predicted protein [Verticillium alfalfae VaMs.102]EEY17982.1 predicted protein [Verticillium alfalfae VaMs.102]
MIAVLNWLKEKKDMEARPVISGKPWGKARLNRTRRHVRDGIPTEDARLMIQRLPREVTIEVLDEDNIWVPYKDQNTITDENLTLPSPKKDGQLTEPSDSLATEQLYEAEASDPRVEWGGGGGAGFFSPICSDTTSLMERFLSNTVDLSYCLLESPECSLSSRFSNMSLGSKPRK